MEGSVTPLDPIDEQRLRLVANTVPALLAYVGPGARYVWCNETYRRWFGRAPESLRGRPMLEVIGEKAWAVLRPYVERALAGEEVTYETRVVYTDGHARDVRAAYVPDRDPQGNVRGFVAQVNDISEMRRAEREAREAREQLQVVVDTTPAIIARYDRGGRVVWANRSYAARFGLEPEALVGKQLREVIGEDALATIEPGFGRMLTGETVDQELEIPYPMLGRRWMHVLAAPTFDGQGSPDGWVSVITDTTRWRELERERERALEELKEADRHKDEFLAMLSHELRNPLAPILTAVEVLRLSDPGDTETAATFHGVIERQVLHMKRLLDDLLDVSRVNQGKIELRRELVELGSVLRQAAEVSRPLMAEKDQRLSVTSASAAVLVHADPARLVQVFGNLLNNAAKYSEPGGAIAVELAVEGPEVVVRVRDQGVGMSPELLERAFDLFVQDARSLDRAQGGMGIGLTMVRRLVEMHGGSVRAFSDGPGQGCEMVVRLPRASETQPLAARPRARGGVTAAARPLRVLVVDDNLDAARTLGHLLGLLGHEVRLAHDGPSALATAAAVPPELVFIDIGLPGMDGYALASALRAAGLVRASLIAVTGYGREEDVRRSAAHGFDHHLVKPVDLAGLQRLAVLRGQPKEPPGLPAEPVVRNPQS